MKFITLLIFIISFLVSQECENNRYIDEIFEIEIETWVEFGENVDYTWGFESNVQLYMDVYQPASDNLQQRPLVIFAFGGAFMFGNRNSADIVSQCESYAKRGYVAAAIDYRLTPSLAFDMSELNVYSAVIKGVHDFKSAVRFFRKNFEEGNEYRIDPNRIYGGGTSAGSIVAIHNAYLDENDYSVPEVIWDILNDTGGIEGNSGNQGYSSLIHGVINLCGGIGNSIWIGENDQPIVSLHGTLDDVVPFEGGINLLGVYTEGSSVIHERMLELGNSSNLWTFEGGGHCDFLSEISTVNEYTSEFMYNIVCSDDENISGDINLDSQINVLDIISVVNIILDDLYNSNADMNGDNEINILDILSIINIILISNE